MSGTLAAPVLTRISFGEIAWLLAAVVPGKYCTLSPALPPGVAVAGRDVAVIVGGDTVYVAVRVAVFVGGNGVAVEVFVGV